MPLCRISKVHELLPDQIVECALDAKSPFDAAGRPALLDPDLVEFHADYYIANAIRRKAVQARQAAFCFFRCPNPNKCLRIDASPNLSLREGLPLLLLLLLCRALGKYFLANF